MASKFHLRQNCGATEKERNCGVQQQEQNPEHNRQNSLSPEHQDGGRKTTRDAHDA
jgi:hypothetical protein